MEAIVYITNIFVVNQIIRYNGVFANIFFGTVALRLQRDSTIKKCSEVHFLGHNLWYRFLRVSFAVLLRRG